MRLAVFGDVGGQSYAFFNALTSLGVDIENHVIPDDLAIIQVGDLIHRGPGSEDILNAVNGFLRNTDQWVQLIGNHELMHVSMRQIRFTSCNCSDRTKELLRELSEDNLLKAAVQVEGENERLVPGLPTLVSHAGITSKIAQRASQSLLTDTIVSELDTMAPWVQRAGIILGGGVPDEYAGPFWAAQNEELIHSWLDLEMPFNQVHGHSAAFMFGKSNRWMYSTSADVKRGMHVDIPNARTTFHALKGGNIVGIDPQFEDKNMMDVEMPFLLLEDARIV